MWIHDTMREYKLCVLMASHVLQDLWSALTESTGIWRRSCNGIYISKRHLAGFFVAQAFKDPG